MDNFWLDKWSFTGFRAYVFAVGITLAGLLFRLILAPVVGDSIPYATFAPAFIAVPLLCGLRPTILVLALTLATVWVFVLGDAPLAQRIVSTFIGMIAFGGVIAGTVLTLRRALTNEAAAKVKADMLSRELNHRIRNLFAVILSFVTLAKRRAAVEDPDEIFQELYGQIEALSRAHSVSLGKLEGNSILLADLLNTALDPYRYGPKTGDVARITMEGPEVRVLVKALTPLGLVLHELATNSLKYGALADDAGFLNVRWSVEERGETAPSQIKIDWREDPVQPKLAENHASTGEAGFGNLMITAAMKQMGGRCKYDWQGDRLDVQVTFPLAARDAAQSGNRAVA